VCETLTVLTTFIGVAVMKINFLDVFFGGMFEGPLEKILGRTKSF
jgi:hypothetical protein